MFLETFSQSCCEETVSVDPSYRHWKQTGYLLSRITDDTGRLRSLFTDIIASLTKDVLIFLVGIFLLYYLDWRLATVSLLALPSLYRGIKFL